MARPKRRLSSHDYLTISAMAARGFRERDIARRLGMAPDTWRRVRDRDPQALEAFEAGRSELHDELISKLLEKAREGQVACLIFSLKILFGYRENQPIEVEHTHNVRIELPAALTPMGYERLQAKAREIPAVLDAEAQRGDSV